MRPATRASRHTASLGSVVAGFVGDTRRAPGITSLRRRADPLALAGLLALAIGCVRGEPATVVTDPPRPGPPVEAAVREISLAGPLAAANAEISGLEWDGARLLLLPQFPEFAGTPALYVLARADIEAYLGAARPAALMPTTIDFVDNGVPARVPGFRGYEAIAVLGDDAWLTIEAETIGGAQGHVVAAKFDSEHSRLALDPASLVIVPAQTRLRNHAEEALVVAGDRVLVLHEIYGVGVNPGPVVHGFDRALRPGPTLTMTPIEYRLTDATSVDADGRFWVINYFFPREQKLRAAHDPISAQHGQGRSHASHATVERLVELELRDGQVVRGPSPPVALELLGDHASRNWEGVVRYGERGFLLATDRHPRTVLALVER